MPKAASRHAAFASLPAHSGNVSNKHQQKTEETRRRLMRSARKVFARDGFEAARLEDISKDAGHTRGAFYAHFSSKEDLFFALLEQQAYEHQVEIYRRLSLLTEHGEKLRALRELYVSKLGDRRWSLLMLEFKLFAVRHPKIRAKLVKTHRGIRAAFRQQVEELLAPVFLFGEEEHLIVRAVLEILFQGLTLELAYDPSIMKQEQAEGVLRRAFALLTRMEKLGSSSNKVD